MKQHTTKTVTPVDMVSALGTDVIESHLRIDYASESSYIDALAAAAWDSIEEKLGEHYGATIYVTHQSELPSNFTLPYTADRIQAINIEVTPEEGVESLLLEGQFSYSGAGYPTHVNIKDVDVELKDIVTPVKITVVLESKTVPKALEQAFLMLVGHLYENRQGVTDVKKYVTPMAIDYLCAPYKNNPLR